MNTGHAKEQELQRIKRLRVDVPTNKMPIRIGESRAQRRYTEYCGNCQQHLADSINRWYQQEHQVNSAELGWDRNCCRCVANGIPMLRKKKFEARTIPGGEFTEGRSDEHDLTIVFEHANNPSQPEGCFYKLDRHGFVIAFDAPELHKEQKQYRVHKDNLLHRPMSTAEKITLDQYLKEHTTTNATSADYIACYIFPMQRGWKNQQCAKAFRKSLESATLEFEEKEPVKILEQCVPMNTDDEILGIMRTETLDGTEAHVELVIWKADVPLCVDFQQSRAGNQQRVATFCPHVLDTEKELWNYSFILFFKPQKKGLKLLNEKLSWDATQEETGDGYISVFRNEWIKMYQWFIQNVNGACLEEWWFEKDLRLGFIKLVQSMDVAAGELRSALLKAIGKYEQHCNLEWFSIDLNKTVEAFDCRPWNSVTTRPYHASGPLVQNLFEVGLCNTNKPEQLVDGDDLAALLRKFEDLDSNVADYVSQVTQLKAMKSLISRTHLTGREGEWVVTLRLAGPKKNNAAEEKSGDNEAQQQSQQFVAKDCPLLRGEQMARFPTTAMWFRKLSKASHDEKKWLGLNYVIGSHQANRNQGKNILYFCTEKWVRNNNIFYSEILSDLQYMVNHNVKDWRNQKLKQVFDSFDWEKWPREAAVFTYSDIGLPGRSAPNTEFGRSQEEVNANVTVVNNNTVSNNNRNTNNWEPDSNGNSNVNVFSQLCNNVNSVAMPCLQAEEFVFTRDPPSALNNKQMSEVDWVAIWEVFVEEMEQMQSSRTWVSKIQGFYKYFKFEHHSASTQNQTQKINSLLRGFDWNNLFQEQRQEFASLEPPFLQESTAPENDERDFSQVYSQSIRSETNDVEEQNNESTLEAWTGKVMLHLKSTGTHQYCASVAIFIFANFVQAGYGLASDGTVLPLVDSDVCAKCYPCLYRRMQSKIAKAQELKKKRKPSWRGQSPFSYSRFWYWFICLALESSLWKLLLLFPSWHAWKYASKASVPIKKKVSQLNWGLKSDERAWIKKWVADYATYSTNDRRKKLLDRLGYMEMEQEQGSNNETTNIQQTNSTITEIVSQRTQKRSERREKQRAKRRRDSVDSLNSEPSNKRQKITKYPWTCPICQTNEHFSSTVCRLCEWDKSKN